jgi:hypothetical protein
MTTPARRRFAVALGVSLLVAAPVAAYWTAPASASAERPAVAIDLAGTNTSALASAAQVIFTTPGIVPLGNSAIGDLAQVSLPYASSTTSTGPTTAGTAAPVYPGDAVANLGNDLQTFEPSIPAALVKLLNDPIAAHSTFPAQLNVGTAGKWTAPGAASLGIGNASTTSSATGTSAHGEVTDISPLGTLSPKSALTKVLATLLRGSMGALLRSSSQAKPTTGTSILEIASATSDTDAAVAASRISTSAHTDVGKINLAGLITIDGISSSATAASNGQTGTPSASLHVGAVTVAGVPASIGPKGITLDKKVLNVGGVSLIPLANTVLTALNTAGISITAIDPVKTVKGSEADVTSGGIVISLEDKDIPNLGALLPQLPLLLPNSIGARLSLGFSQASANATRLPAVGTGGGGVPPSVNPGGGQTGVTNPGGTGVGSVTTPSGPVTSTGSPGGGSPPVVATAPEAAILGVPVRVAWVVIAFLLSLLAAGPLLAYANWQLLRGRSS